MYKRCILGILLLPISLSSCVEAQQGTGQALGNVGSAIGSVSDKVWETPPAPPGETQSSSSSSSSSEQSRRY